MSAHGTTRRPRTAWTSRTAWAPRSPPVRALVSPPEQGREVAVVLEFREIPRVMFCNDPQKTDN